MSLFKRNKKEPTKTKMQQKVKVERVTEQIEEYQTKLQTAEGEDQIPLLNMLGSLYFEIEDYDQAIKYYEASIEENKALGKAFTDLIKLYNLKRKEATKENDKEKVQFYLQKADELMKLTKDSIRGRI
ncbi:tetratricopeptide repeat protein [Gracilibacillus suaedae]|uniref:tetratricopeptide repeat protein n=1 Tax=Gracilibacillus suaedae TaxID=2820273 RepID=UPI001ABE91C0|nr:tetratricopeptide repeat protein [Gracilibacillus suaedae]